MSGSTTSGPLRLQDVRDAILANEWAIIPVIGTLWAWGISGSGQLGQNNTSSINSPVQIPGTSWSCISAGFGISAALKTDGTLWAWGAGSQGEMGVNDTTSRSSPIQIPGTSWTNISLGYQQFVMAQKSDGTLWAWGRNDHGRLGQNNLIARSSPVQIPGTSWNEISTGSSFVLARKTDNTLWTWGYASYMGDNNRISRSSPVQIPGTQWVQIEASATTSIARKTDGTIWTWGSAYAGQLGINATGRRSSPVQVPGTSWTSVFAGASSSRVGALKSDGTLWVWGNNPSGELGDNTIVAKSSPIQIPGTTWSSIWWGGSVTQGIAVARKTDNTLWTWGLNYGRLGTNDSPSRSSPIQLPGNNWTAVRYGNDHGIARKTA